MSVARIILALLAGALSGGLLVVFFDLFVQLVLQDRQYDLKYALQHSLSIFVMAFLVWLVGLLIAGAPGWLLMHKSGKILWYHAAFFGFVVCFLVNFALLTKGFQLLPAPMGSSYSAGDSGGATWINNRLTVHGWVAMFKTSLLIAIAAVPVTLTLWWVAYRAGR